MQHNEKWQELIWVISWSQWDATREKANECASWGITNQLGCNKGQWWGVVGIVGEKMNTMSKSSGKSQGSQGGKVERPGVDVMRNSFSSFC